MDNSKSKGTIRRELTSFSIDIGMNGSGGISDIIENALINSNYDLDITPIKDKSGLVIKEEIKVFFKQIASDSDNIPKCY